MDTRVDRPASVSTRPDAESSADAWSDAVLAAALLAVDPQGLGGCHVRSPAGPVRDQWLALVRRWLPSGMPWCKVPVHIQDDRLLGGLDLAATLATQRPVAQRGVLASAHGGLTVWPMAERLSAATVARLCAVLDTGVVQVQREGLSAEHPARIGVVALDEGDGPDESVRQALADRLAFRVDLDGIVPSQAADAFSGDEDSLGQEVARARGRLHQVQWPDGAIDALVEAAQQLGIASLRAPWLALRTACAHAALEGTTRVAEQNLALAARLVLAPRATRLPSATEAGATASDPPAKDEPGETATPPPPEPGESDSAPPPAEGEPPQADGADVRELQELVLAATLAAIPDGLLQRLQGATVPRGPATGDGAGAARLSLLRGRPLGSRRAAPAGGARLHLLDTLRAAAPWQRLRQQERQRRLVQAPARRVLIRQDDFHVRQFRQPRETTTLFVVDASGSSALHRLAEAKGAVELLLADCYVRRDKVAVISFRGRGADMLLAPTRSLVRAKRSLAALPGGGGTPLAQALDLAGEVAQTARRRGDSVTVVLLTDGRANVARDGSGGREAAQRDAMASASLLRHLHVRTLLIDTSPQPAAQARLLADALAASYVALPYADSHRISEVVRQAGARGV